MAKQGIWQYASGSVIRPPKCSSYMLSYWIYKRMSVHLSILYAELKPPHYCWYPLSGNCSRFEKDLLRFPNLRATTVIGTTGMVFPRWFFSFDYLSSVDFSLPFPNYSFTFQGSRNNILYRYNAVFKPLVFISGLSL